MEITEYLKKITKEIREHFAGDYLDICFNGDSIMISNCDDIKLHSLDNGENWTSRESM